MFLAPSAFTRRRSPSALSPTSVNVVAPCAQECVKCCCYSRRVLRAPSNRLTMETANYTSPSLSPQRNCPTGNRGSRPEELQSKKSASGNWEAGASTLETPTVICSNSPPQAPGPSIDLSLSRSLLIVSGG